MEQNFLFAFSSPLQAQSPGPKRLLYGLFWTNSLSTYPFPLGDVAPEWQLNVKKMSQSFVLEKGLFDKNFWLIYSPH